MSHVNSPWLLLPPFWNLGVFFSQRTQRDINKMKLNMLDDCSHISFMSPCFSGIYPHTLLKKNIHADCHLLGRKRQCWWSSPRGSPQWEWLRHYSRHFIMRTWGRPERAQQTVPEETQARGGTHTAYMRWFWCITQHWRLKRALHSQNCACEDIGNKQERHIVSLSSLR